MSYNYNNSNKYYVYLNNRSIKIIYITTFLLGSLATDLRKRVRLKRSAPTF